MFITSNFILSLFVGVTSYSHEKIKLQVTINKLHWLKKKGERWKKGKMI